MHGGGGGGGARGKDYGDELKTKIYDRRLFSRMIHYLKPYMKWVIFSFVILMLISAAEVVLPLVQRSAIDDYIVSDKSIAIFNDEAVYKDFYQRYHKLKFKEYAHGNQHFIIISAKDRNKINRSDMQNLKEQGILGDTTVYLITDKPEHIAILNRHLQENLNPAATKDRMMGWFRLGSGKIAVAKNELLQLPKNDRLAVRGEASRSLFYLALIFFGIITLRFITSYLQSVVTAYFSQMAMADLRHDVFEHLQKMPTKYFDQNPVGRLVTRVTNDIRAIDEMLANRV